MPRRTAAGTVTSGHENPQSVDQNPPSRHRLDRAHAQRDTGTTLLLVEPSLAPLHGDPRWADLLRKVGFTD